jgi:hypothetical protein
MPHGKLNNINWPIDDKCPHAMHEQKCPPYNMPHKPKMPQQNAQRKRLPKASPLQNALRAQNALTECASESASRKRPPCKMPSATKMSLLNVPRESASRKRPTNCPIDYKCPYATREQKRPPYNMRFKPIAVSIETKRAGAGDEEAGRIQLDVWAGA